MRMTPDEAAHAFVAAINAADLPSLRRLMTEDHTFTDALGNSSSGAEKMIAGWQAFFRVFPEYWIRIEHGFAEGNWVGLFGEAGGKRRIGDRIAPGSWRVAAAWLAEIEGGLVKSWRVFCDTGWATPSRDQVG